MTDHAELIERLMFNTPVITQDHMNAATEIMPQAAARLTALLAENEALRADVARKDEALRKWRTAFWVADNFAVAIHDADGKCYSVRAQDYHEMDDLYHDRAALSPQRHDSPTAGSGRDQGGEG